MRTTCEQCGKTFSKPTKLQAESALRMHVGRKHGNIKLPTEIGKRADTRTDAQEGAPTRTDAHRDEPPSRILADLNLTPAQLHKREYQRKYRKGRQKQNLNGAVVVHFCPRCGMNLEVLATALQVANKVHV